MAFPKCGKPPSRDAIGGSLKVQCLAACTSENSTSHFDPQILRVTFLARRYAIPPAAAHLIAELALGEARQ